jgi:hypothetical protein
MVHFTSYHNLKESLVKSQKIKAVAEFYRGELEARGAVNMRADISATFASLPHAAQLNHCFYLTEKILELVDQEKYHAAYRLLSFLQAMMLVHGIEQSIEDLMRRNMPDDVEFTATPHG